MYNLDFSEANLPKLLENNRSRPKDKTPHFILIGVGILGATLTILSVVAYVIEKQRTNLRRVISACPTEVLSSEVCTKLGNTESIDIVTPHNIAPMCAINPSFEAHQRWTRNVCQLAADRSDLPNLATACTVMTNYMHTVKETTRDACRTY